MPKIDFNGISKTFGTNTVIRRFNASVEDGEFLVLLGPSGCGKSTLLRMIAGLSEISGGEMLFDGQRANDWSPKQRGVAFVFQSYALYPHMTVRANIAFPLVIDRFKKWHHIPIINMIHRWQVMNRPEVKAAVDRIAEHLELTPLLDRRPGSLSGGQRQRVALARSLVRDPSLYMLDEPLSNLDAKLRTQMRSEITTLHQKVKKTFVYVTHDQVEAMTMATRIVVMNGGVIQQIGTPDEIYDEPANTFVAKFVGAPPMNLIPVKYSADRLTTYDGVSWTHGAGTPGGESSAIFGIRPEKLELRPEGQARIPARVAVIERLGAETIIGCRLGLEDAGEGISTEDLVFVRMPGHPGFAHGDACSLDYDDADAVWFDKPTGKRVHAAPAAAARCA
ncbi:ABC transporter ATP-binding protein [Tropicibacter naphthalenivorans]|uniref:Trehalose import ATP-binding protein SugC n=1 Tax=Tropicibacter naphthalenivorans TaxID=441103 RepID=A0A0P1GH11_9RHOB|nr:ABC transporter ATP-binding protein [Tropicibacter naphthalenivorans]CUH80962.1 Trehalose import ATP-binding protein SugC [Tropicibacter naphthalenivorans]SMC91433.1 carbohydrate ABC transporter ATP-binding protein, CUT1 family [Tropicibacter naphthalenivorans]